MGVAGNKLSFKQNQNLPICLFHFSNEFKMN